MPGRLHQLLRLAAEEFLAVHGPLPAPAFPQNASPTAAHACDALLRAGARQHTASNGTSQPWLQDARGGHGGFQLACARGWRSVSVPASAPHAQHGPDRRRQFQTSAAARAHGKSGAATSRSSSSDAEPASAAGGQPERVKKRGRRSSSSEATAAAAAETEPAAPNEQARSPPTASSRHLSWLIL